MTSNIGTCNYARTCKVYYRADPNCNSTDGGSCKLPKDFRVMRLLGISERDKRLMMGESLHEIVVEPMKDTSRDYSQTRPDGVNN